MTFFEEEIVFVLVPKATYDAYTSSEQCGIINRSTLRKSENLKVVSISDVDNYCFESIRRMAVECKLVEFKFYNNKEMKVKLGV